MTENNLLAAEPVQAPAVYAESYEAVLAERDEYRRDVCLTAQTLAALLKDLGILQPDGSYTAPKPRKLVATITTSLMGGSDMADRFGYLVQLAPLIEKYSHMASE